MSKLNLKLKTIKNRALAWAKGSACLFFIVLSSSFQLHKDVIAPIEDENYDGNKLVTLHSQEFSAFSNRVHRQITYNGADTISVGLLEKALRGYMYLKHTETLTNPNYLTILNFEKSSKQKRLWVLDMESKTIIFNELVAHGKNTGDEFAKYFSNFHSSHNSSVVCYITSGTYHGSKNLSLKLNGLEQGFNSNAFTRGVVIHGANYVNEQIVAGNQRIGRSYGCPAVSHTVNKALVNTIKGGSCLFIYHPTPKYLENSKIVNANLYLTVDDLSI